MVDQAVIQMADLLKAAAANPDPIIRQPANQQLMNMQSNTPEVLPVLLTQIAVSSNVFDENTRFYALAFFKQSLPACWSSRSRGGQNVDLTTRDSVKNALLKRLTEEQDNRVVLQISTLLAKVARDDWPQQWSSLFLEIIKFLESNNPTLIYRGLIFLNDVLEELTSKRLAQDRTEFQTGAYSFIGYVFQVWESEIRRLISFFTSPVPEGEFDTVLELALLSTRCMNQLIISGIPDLDKSAEARKFFNAVHEVLQSFVPVGVLSLHSNANLMVKFEKLVFSLAETVVDAEQSHTIAFRVFLLDFLQLFSNQLISLSEVIERTGSLLLADYAVVVMSFLKYSNSYKHNRLGASFSTWRGVKFDTAAAHDLETGLDNFFDATFSCNLASLLIEKFIPLHQLDIELWKTEPEKFWLDSQMSLQGEMVRPAALSLFQSLLEKHPNQIADVCLRYLQQALSDQNSLSDDTMSKIDGRKILFKECIYTILGVGCHDLHPKLNSMNFSFPELLKRVLVRELQVEKGGPKILRARIALLIGEWYEMDPVSKADQPVVYSVLVSLAKDNDIVVALNSILALKFLIDSDEFSPEKFHGLQVDFMNVCLKTINESSELDVRSFILEVICIFVKRMKDFVAPITRLVIECLPYLWEISSQQNVLRGSIIQILCNLVHSLGPRVRDLEDFIVSVLGVAVNPNIEANIHLLESGLDLWLTLLQNSSSMSSQTLAIFAHWPNLFEYNFDNHGQLLAILRSYVLLGGGDFFSQYSTVINSTFAKALPMINEELAGLICDILDDICVIVGPSAFMSLSETMVQIIAEIFCEPRTRSDKTIATELCVVARFFLSDFNFITGVMAFAKRSLQSWIDLCLDKFDNIGLAYQRKMCALALLKFVPTRDFELLNRCGLILSAVTGVIFELQDDIYIQQLQINPDRTFWTENDRREMINLQDPVNSVKLKDLLRSTLANEEVLHGEPSFQKLLSELVDPAILNQVMLIVRGTAGV